MPLSPSPRDLKVPAVSKHIKNIYEEGELDLLSTVSKKEIVRKEGSREVRRQVDFYNLDVIISNHPGGQHKPASCKIRVHSWFIYGHSC